MSENILKIINSSSKEKDIIHKAGLIIIDPLTIIKDAYIYIKSGIIKEVGMGKGPKGLNSINNGHGVILPVLINAHTHLELSALKGKLSCDNGFLAWIKELINVRAKTNDQELLDFSKKSIIDLKKSGCNAIGEISSLGYTKEILIDSNMDGVWFKEYLGNDNDNISFCSGDQIYFSIAGHAPHTTSPQLLKKLKNKAKNCPFSIHLAESEEEIEFLDRGKGKWADFLNERGIDFSNWNIKGEKPVPYLKKLGLLDQNTILVHLLYSEKNDYDIIFENCSNVCLCLRSNKNLHSKLADIYEMLKRGIKPCIGTDSLACVDSLSIFHEMEFIARHFPLVEASEILAMATVNGARALGIYDKIGSLHPGKKACFLYLELDPDCLNEPIEAIINGNFSSGKIYLYDSKQ